MSLAPLVGRELDLAVCLEQLKRVERGAAVGLLVRGVAGIGKSRLVAELAVRARQLGHPVLAGRADDLDHGIPYALFRDLLARLALDEDASRPDAVDEAADELRRALDAPARGDDDPLGAVFAVAVELLRAVAGSGPLVLVLEDVHVADRESQALVALLARLAGVGVLTVVTLRPGAAIDTERLVEQMALDGRASVVDLEPLDRHDVQALVASVLGASPDDALTDAVHAASNGNPFFATELALSYADAGAVVVIDGRARLLPDAPAASLGPGTALLRRLVGGTSADAELAKVLAVFGRFPLRHLGLVERILDRTPTAIDESFDRLVKAGLLVATAQGHEFSHPIVRATLYEDIGPAERRRIHAAIAAELAAQRRSGVVLDVLELATHVSASAEPGDEGAAAVLLEAGRSVAATAPLVAAGHLRRAADLLADGSPARADALAREARALHLGGRPAEAAVVGKEALDGGLTGDRRSATVAFVVNDLYLGGDVEGSLRVVDGELAAGAAPCPLLAMRVNLAMEAGRFAEAAAGFEDALASSTGPPAAELMAITHLVQYANHVGRVEIADELLERLDRLAADGSATVQFAAHELVAFADWRPGLVDRIEARLAAARSRRPDGSSLNIASTFEQAKARVLALRGEWDDALELIRRASLDLEQRGNVMGAQLLLALGVELLIDRGALDEAAATAERLVTPIQALERYAAYVRGRLHHALGDLAKATEVLDGERRRVEGVADFSRWKLAEVLAELAIVRSASGDDAAARALADELDDLAAQLGWPECRAAALRTRAIVDRDSDAARAAVDHAETEGWVVDEARARLLLGELDVEPVANLTAAYRSFDGFGAAPWRRRAAAGLRARGLTVPRRAAQVHAGLTETEVQLVRLVREGLTNRQIATAMHYSTKTIEVYLSRVYAKTSCASRLELIRALDAGTVEV